MYGGEIENIMTEYDKAHSKYNHFLGVFALDNIPVAFPYHSSPASSYNNKYSVGFIMNSDPSYKPGVHWIAILLKSPTAFEFFDSYALPLSAYFDHSTCPHLSSFRCTHSLSRQIQSNDSDFCGQHCIFFLIHRIYLKMTFSQIIGGHFDTRNSLANDNLVTRYVCRLGYCPGQCKHSCSNNRALLQCCRSKCSCK